MAKKKEQLEKQLSASYVGQLPIGGIELSCAVLDNGERILTATSVFTAFGRARKGVNSRLEIDGAKIPPFLAAKNLEPLITEDILDWLQPVEYLDGSSIRKGYKASLIPKMCDIYLRARREGLLTKSQEKLAIQSEILLTALAQVGIDALIDEATGYQRYRTHDALRILMAKYLEAGVREWIHTFPDSFFKEMDKLYSNPTTSSRNRPMYYGKFINKYIYQPIEKGTVKEELNKLNIDDAGRRRARFHQWLTESGRTVLLHQIGRIQGKMETCASIDEFKALMDRDKQNMTIAPEFWEYLEKNESE